ncbi:hypothetical protein [Gemmatimonas sp.]|uniref:hypothetical protein n=1 Tax=Gemmatimonas sp. TaxID=1962908 RepID=UPI003982F149
MTSATGSPLTGLFVEVGTPTVRIPCDPNAGRCVVNGNAGSYTLRFGAPGYQTLQRGVAVTAVRAGGDCACDAVTTQRLQLTLVPL